MIRDALSIDLRSLAAMRIGVASVALADLAVRATDLSVHYTDRGLLPCHDLLSVFADWHAVPACIHLLGGSTWSQALLFGVHALALVAVMAGWRTRTATIVAWAMTTSLVLRNPLVSYGADNVLRMVLLWGVLAPLGARWSVDALLSAPRGEDEEEIGSWRGVAAAGLLLQVFVVVFVAGLAKAATGFWVDGEGLARALDHEMHTRRLGLLLAGAPRLSTALTWAVLFLETVGAVLLFAPWWRLRVLVLAAMAAMFAGIEATMRVGFFPAATTAALLVFVPARAWDAMAARWRPPADAGDRLRAAIRRIRAWTGLPLASSAQRPAASTGTRIARDVFATLLVAWTLAWNVGLWRRQEPPVPQAVLPFGQALALWQKWGMFTAFPQTGWFAVPGHTVDGRALDLFASRGRLPDIESALAGAALAESRPAHVADRFRNVHWAAYFYTLASSMEREGPFLAYGRYFCREWNRAHAGVDALQGLEILWFRRDTGDPSRVYGDADYERVVLWRHRCFD